MVNNIWVNPGEDDGDGIPEFYSISQGGDEDDIDNDNNGYVDDLVGWDFYDFLYGGDNNPTPPGGWAYGTAVAGIVSAQTNNTMGVAGVAGGWGYETGVALMNLRHHHWDHSNGALSVAQSITYAIENGAKVINMSLAFTYPYQHLFDACSIAANNYDCVLVAGAGNNGGNESDDKSIRYPAKYPTTIAVGATIQDDSRWNTDDWRGFGSAIGPELDLMAPGGDTIIYTTDNMGSAGYSSGNYCESFGGTSASSPIVAGIAALLRSIDPSFSWQEVREIIKSSAEKVDGMGGEERTDEYGYGRVNGFYAVAPPSAPQNLSISLDFLNHPYLAWNENTEPDLKEYQIWRKVQGIDPNFVLYDITTNNYYTDQSVSYHPKLGNSVYYKIKAIDVANFISAGSNTVSTHGLVSFPGQGPLIINSMQIPEEIILFDNYPNPFNPSTSISFGIPNEQNIVINIYSITGEKVNTLLNGMKSRGYHTVNWNGKNELGERVSSGTYIYELKVGDERFVKKMLMIKQLLFHVTYPNDLLNKSIFLVGRFLY